MMPHMPASEEVQDLEAKCPQHDDDQSAEAWHSVQQVNCQAPAGRSAGKYGLALCCERVRAVSGSSLSPTVPRAVAAATACDSAAAGPSASSA